jgi:hypothetical protein
MAPPGLRAALLGLPAVGSRGRDALPGGSGAALERRRPSRARSSPHGGAVGGRGCATQRSLYSAFPCSRLTAGVLTAKARSWGPPLAGGAGLYGRRALTSPESLAADRAAGAKGEGRFSRGTVHARIVSSSGRGRRSRASGRAAFLHDILHGWRWKCSRARACSFPCAVSRWVELEAWEYGLRQNGLRGGVWRSRRAGQSGATVLHSAALRRQQAARHASCSFAPSYCHINSKTAL